MSDRDQMLAATWHELRSEISQYMDEHGYAAGFAGHTRFWCPIAVFDIYWITEARDSDRVQLSLTDNLRLTGFRGELDFEPDLDFLQKLATGLNWDQSAVAALREVAGDQFDFD